MAEIITPPPELWEDLNSSFRIGRNNGKFQMTREFHALHLIGLTPPERLAQALSLTATGVAHAGANLPDDGEEREIVVVGKAHKVYANVFDVEPWSNDEAGIRVTYTHEMRGQIEFIGFGPVTKEVGASVEEIETDFDWENLQKPYEQRKRITVRHNSWRDAIDYTTPLQTHEDRPQDVRVRMWRGKPVLNFTRDQTADPEPMADEFVGFTNNAVWRGYAKNTVLCIAIVGRSIGTGVWNTLYSFARDKNGFKQYARWINPDTGNAPELTVPMILGFNGVREITVQGDANFAQLNIPQ